MTSRVASLRLQLIDAVSGPAKAASSAARGLEKNLAKLGKEGVPGAQRLGRQYDWLKQKSEAAFRFNNERRELSRLYKDFRDARSNVARISETLAVASREPKKFAAAINVLKRDLSAANSALRSTTSAFGSQRAAVKSAEQALRMYGINGARAAASSQQVLRDQMAKTLRQMRALEREARRTPPPGKPPIPPQPHAGHEGGAGGAVAGGIVANVTKNAAQRGFGLAVAYSEAENIRNAAGRFSEADKKRMNAQAERIGGDTRFSNADVLRAQGVIVRKGIQQADQVVALTDAIADYALALGVSMEEGAETVEGIAQARGIDASDVDQVRRLANQLVTMAIKSGMSDDDIRQFNKYSAAPTKILGFTDAQSSGIGMALRRRSVPGAEAGTFARSMSSYLIAPTNPGRAAMANAGVDYNKYAKVDAFNPTNFATAFKGRFGRELPDEVKERIAELVDPDKSTFLDEKTGQMLPLLANQSEFVAQAQKAIEPMYAKKGKVGAQDAAKIAKFLNDTYQMSIDNIDAFGLLKEIMAKMGPGEIVKMFGSKQGARAQILQQSWGRYEQDVETLENAPPDYAHQIGKDMNAGLYGDWTKLTGTVETALTRIVNDWEGPLRGIIQGLDTAVDGFTNLSDSTRKLIEAFIAAAAIFGAYNAYSAGKSVLENLLGGGKGKGGGAGGGGGKGGAFGRLLGRGLKVGGAAGAAWTGASVLGDADPSGTLWGLFDGPNEFIKKHAGFDPSRSEWVKSPTQRYNETVGANKKASIEQAIAPLDAAIASWPERAKAAMMDYGEALVQGGADAEAKATTAAAAIKQELSFTAHPDVNTEAFERALALARQVAGAIRGIEGGGGAYETPPNSNPTFGGPRRNGGGVQAGKSYLIGEAGPEIATFGQSGRIVSNEQARAAFGGGGASISMPVSVKIEVNGASAADLKRAGEQAAQAVVTALQGSLNRGLSRSSQVAFSNTRYGDA